MPTTQLLVHLLLLAFAPPVTSTPGTISQEEETQELQDELTALRAGKLIQYGITAGAALLLQAPGPKAGPKLSGPYQVNAIRASGSVYLQLLPAYWGWSESLRSYCATAWAAGGEHAAGEAAQAVARKKARVLSESLINEVSMRHETGKSATQIKIDMTTGESNWLEDHTPIIEGRKALKADHIDVAIAIVYETDLTEAEKRTRLLESSIASELWRRGLRGSCGLSKVGVWVGFTPTRYDARIIHSQIPDGVWDAERPVQNITSFGVAFTPNAYVSVLFGMTYSRFDWAEGGLSHGLWTMSIGLGGNLDLVTLFSGR